MREILRAERDARYKLQCFRHLPIHKTDRSLPSIFSYFYSITQRAEEIVRELDASAKRKTLTSV